MYGKMKKNIAVILAGGVGSRLGLSTPKQFFKVAGKMVVEHTVEALSATATLTKSPSFPTLSTLLNLRT